MARVTPSVQAINSRSGRLDAPCAHLALRNTAAVQAADADFADRVRSVVRPRLEQRIAASCAGN